MPISTIDIDNKNFKISYKIFHLDKSKNIIILHGWGSNKEIMQKSFAMQKSFLDYKLLFIDLPGFGKSDNNYVLDTKDYANAINTFLKKMNIKKNIIIGHSFGGKIATILKPDILVLLSSAGIVPKKSFDILVKIYIFKALKYIGFGFLYKLFASKDVEGMSENMYKTFKNVVDEDFTKEFENFSNPTLIFWGEDDVQTPISSGKKIASLIKDSIFLSQKGEHFFFVQNNTFIANKINEFAK